MKVNELIAILAAFPQDADCIIFDNNWCELKPEGVYYSNTHEVCFEGMEEDE